ncbi:MAG TPA: phosphoribosyl-AMP cyclohydrolase [Terriglobia bacterium]
MNLDFSKLDGLVAAVIQDHSSGRVLMVGFMNEDAFRQTVETGYATFYSRSRGRLWMKGETSGHRLLVKEISTDCDRDAVLLKVEALGPGVCHEGYQSCFFRRLDHGQWVMSEPRAFDPEAVYSSATGGETPGQSRDRASDAGLHEGLGGSKA